MASPPLSSPPRPAADVLLAGGGLSNSLIALRLKARRPELRVAMFDAHAPGDPDPHTWCFFESDVTTDVRSWLDPLAEHRWQGYDVRFPSHARTLSTPYASMRGTGLQRAVAAALGADLHLGRRVVALDPHGLTLEDGVHWRAPLVIDGRGARPSSALSLAWQKFVGLELRLEAPHGLTRPTIMDASVEQLDGYRFVYLLPFGPDRLLVEDTYYSDAAALDRPALEARILAYAAARGWRVAEVAAREEGVLPIALGGDLDAYLAEAPGDIPAVGLRAPLFHPVTGYSLPEAAALAHELAETLPPTSAAAAAWVQARVRRRWRETGFLRALNRMLFLAAEPQERYRVLQRFYRLPQPLVERFYAGRMRLADRVRTLAGVPPVGIGPAMRALPETSLLRSQAL